MTTPTAAGAGRPSRRRPARYPPAQLLPLFPPGPAAAPETATPEPEPYPERLPTPECDHPDKRVNMGKEQFPSTWHFICPACYHAWFQETVARQYAWRQRNPAAAKARDAAYDARSAASAFYFQQREQDFLTHPGLDYLKTA